MTIQRVGLGFARITRRGMSNSAKLRSAPRQVSRLVEVSALGRADLCDIEQRLRLTRRDVPVYEPPRVPRRAVGVS